MVLNDFQRRRALRATSLALTTWAAGWLAFGSSADADNSKPVATGSRPVGARSGPVEVGSATFEAVAKPFLAKHCITCHGGNKPSGSLSLAKANAKSLREDRDSWEAVREKLSQGEMPPKKKPQPSSDEKKAFLAWLDDALAATACTSPADPGRVTLRRLNRVEYNNTIRDLLGVDVQPAEDFPADDVGYGFDNVGDVLAVSPLLFEKYLTAAEQVVEKAFAEELVPLPPTVTYRGSEMKATAKSDGLYDWVSESRSFNARGFTKAFSDGEIFVDHRFSGDGAYVFEFAAYGAQIDEDKIHAAVSLDGKVVQDLTLRRFRAENRPDGQSFRIKVPGGLHRLSVKLSNAKADPAAQDPKLRNRAMVVYFLRFRGPIPEVMRLPSASYKRIMIAHPGKDLSEAEAARRICESLARRAFRRTVSPAEVERLVKLVELARSRGDEFDQGVRLALQAVLVSPNFLFKVEHDRRSADKPFPITEHELATRLSYFLWSSMPDDELFALADRGELQENLELQVRRMLKDPKAVALGDNFAGQWLQVRNVKSIMIDPALFPQLDDGLRAAFAKETMLFFESIVNENRSILDFIDGDYTFVNERLAKYYGLPGVKGPEFRRVSLKGTPRAGILTQGSVLTITSNATRTSPVKRGKYVLETILNAPPPPPPPNVPELKETIEAIKSASLRQRMEQHRANPECAVCHDKMDALGFAFENFDAVGGWRVKDGAFPIDPSGTLPDGRSFADPAGLRALLRAEPDKFRRCLAEKLLTYALGRGVDSSDRCAVDQIVKTTAEQGDKFAEMVLAVVKSDPFRMRSPADRAKKK
jgi:hypothetical protein